MSRARKEVASMGKILAHKKEAAKTADSINETGEMLARILRENTDMIKDAIQALELRHRRLAGTTGIQEEV